MTTPMMGLGLTITWTDWRGKVWDLTTGSEGVVLDVEQSGLDWAKIDQSFSRGGMVHQATTIAQGEHHLAVTVGWDRTGADYARLRAEWWTQANSPYMDRAGTLSVTTPGAGTRTRRLVMAASPETTFRYDPLLGVDYPTEVWSLTGPSPWWEGQTQVQEYGQAAFTGSTGIPFYGSTGKGWPLYISAASVVRDVFMSNDGQGPMWLRWTLQGPLSSPRVGTEAGVLTYAGDIPAGETVTIDTHPATRAVVEATSGQSRYGEVGGYYRPLPTGDRSPLVMSAEGLTAESKISVSGVTSYATAF